MPEETDDNKTTQEGEKPTITIAEKQGGSTQQDDDAKPTITIAEKEGGK